MATPDFPAFSPYGKERQIQFYTMLVMLLGYIQRAVDIRRMNEGGKLAMYPTRRCANSNQETPPPTAATMTETLQSHGVSTSMKAIII